MKESITGKLLLKLFIIVIFSANYIRCNGFKVETKLPQDYVLLREFEQGGRSISVDLGNGNFVECIPSNIIAFEYNKDFILAKQGTFKKEKLEKDFTNYYIIPISRKLSQFPELNKIGPLNILDFKKKAQGLFIPQILIEKLESE